MTSETRGEVFEIGLIMAGAVSAGAYTAGVIDYLIETLDTWYDMKSKEPNGFPTHDVRIRVMTGASAGGMSTAITIAQLLSPEKKTREESLLYKSWVKDIDISDLLGTKDLDRYPFVRSLLDSTRIEDIASDVIPPDNLPRWKRIPYVHDELRVFLTLSNLRGLPYEFKLEGETGFPFGMTDHSDYQYIKVYEKTPDSEWIKLRNAAIATGAFPVGLAPRLIERDLSEYRERINKDGRDVSDKLKLDTSSNGQYTFVAVDGGTLNNEPIELARSVFVRPQAVTAKAKENLESIVTADGEEHDFKEERTMKEVVRQEIESRCPYALILIDPFPDQVDAGDNATEKDTALGKVVGPLIQALRAQSLFKIEELLDAADINDPNRFLVAPIRYTRNAHDNSESRAPNAIASGFMSGFGGFVSQRFREHDYWLGRRNCQQFLRKYFVMPLNKAETFGWPIESSYVIERFIDGKKELFYPIIPIIKGSRVDAPEGERNPWPTYSNSESRVLSGKIRNRVTALIEKAFPVGWISSIWITLAIVATAVLFGLGEYLKNSQLICDCTLLFTGLRNSYLIIGQVALLFILFSLLLLRVGKIVVERYLATKAHRIVISQMVSWGINIASRLKNEGR